MKSTKKHKQLISKFLLELSANEYAQAHKTLSCVVEEKVKERMKSATKQPLFTKQSSKTN